MPTKRSKAVRRPTVDAISLLKADHQKVSGLFERYEKSGQD